MNTLRSKRLELGRKMNSNYSRIAIKRIVFRRIYRKCKVSPSKHLPENRFAQVYSTTKKSQRSLA